MASKKKILYNVEIGGIVWYGHLAKDRADYEAIRARKLGIGMAYVVEENQRITIVKNKLLTF
jgi:hypothetical protein